MLRLQIPFQQCMSQFQAKFIYSVELGYNSCQMSPHSLALGPPNYIFTVYHLACWVQQLFQCPLLPKNLLTESVKEKSRLYWIFHWPRRSWQTHCSANDLKFSLSHFRSSKSLSSIPLLLFFSCFKSHLVSLQQSFLNSYSFLFSPSSWEEFRFCSILLHSRYGLIFFLRHITAGAYTSSPVFLSNR